VRVRTVLDFILRAVFGSKTGRAGIVALLVKILVQILSIWQAVDFLPSHIESLLEFLNSLWGTLVLIGLGFLLIGKAVYDRWPEPQHLGSQESSRAPTSEPTPESQQPPASENKQPKTQSKQRQKWFRRTTPSSSRPQETSLDLTEHNNFVALKVLLRDAEQNGRQLCQNDPSFDEAQQWVTRTHNLLDAALGFRISAYFLNDEGIESYNVGNRSDSQQWLHRRIARLSVIRNHIDSYTLQPGFKRQDWMDN
jgi:hypothetical protein